MYSSLRNKTRKLCKESEEKNEIRKEGKNDRQFCLELEKGDRERRKKGKIKGEFQMLEPPRHTVRGPLFLFLGKRSDKDVGTACGVLGNNRYGRLPHRLVFLDPPHHPLSFPVVSYKICKKKSSYEERKNRLVLKMKRCA